MNDKNQDIVRPKISVIIPTVNRMKSVDLSLQSVLKQTDLNSVEVVVIDNASNDRTWEILLSKSEIYRFRLIRNLERLNIVNNWQKALEVSSGEYVLILGDDDYLFPNWVEKCKQYINCRDKPSFISWNHITYIKWVPSSGWSNLLVTPKYFDRQSTNLEGSSVRKKYLRQKSSYPVNPHPSLFLFCREEILRIEEKYSTNWFEGQFPDYHAGILAGEFIKSGLFLDEPLVCIGGVEERYYCRKRSKMRVFSSGSVDYLDNFDIPVSLKDMLEVYLTVPAVRQLKFSCNKVNYPMNVERALVNRLPELIENIVFCDKLFGKECIKGDLENLAETYGNEKIRSIRQEVFKQYYKAFFVKAAITFFGQRFTSILWNRLNRNHKVKYIVNSRASCIATTVAYFLETTDTEEIT